MAKLPHVQEGDYIVHDVGEAGLNFAWSPGEVLRVGIDIDVGGANARIQSYDGDEPRAHVIPEEEALPLISAQSQAIADSQIRANEVAPPENREREDPRVSRWRREAAQEESNTSLADELIEERKIDAAREWGKDPVEEARKEERSAPEEIEKAIEPAAEQREKAVPTRSRKRVKPPKEKEKKEEDDA